jgi:hypothetical protein
MSKVKGASGDYARVEALLAESGVAMPPMPADARTRLKEREEWCFCTRSLKVSPSELPHFLRKAIAGVSPDYVLIAQAGRAVGSSALHYFLVQGPLQIFLQIGWGGGSAEKERSTALLNECFALAHRLVGAIPEALRRGWLPRQGRITVVGSSPGESFWEVAAAGERASQPGGPPRGKTRGGIGPRDVLEEAVLWCRGKGAVVGRGD